MPRKNSKPSQENTKVPELTKTEWAVLIAIIAGAILLGLVAIAAIAFPPIGMAIAGLVCLAAAIAGLYGIYHWAKKCFRYFTKQAADRDPVFTSSTANVSRQITIDATPSHIAADQTPLATQQAASDAMPSQTSPSNEKKLSK